MINLISKPNIKGINLFNIFRVCLTKDKGLLVNTIGVTIKLFKFEIALIIGKESSNAKKVKQNFKEQKNNDALA